MENLKIQPPKQAKSIKALRKLNKWSILFKVRFEQVQLRSLVGSFPISSFEWMVCDRTSETRTKNLPNPMFSILSVCRVPVAESMAKEFTTKKRQF